VKKIYISFYKMSNLNIIPLLDLLENMDQTSLTGNSNQELCSLPKKVRIFPEIPGRQSQKDHPKMVMEEWPTR
jgi:hypothetical protein